MNMVETEYQLKEEIIELIQSGREDDWWDFKECHHEDKASLLHDIICMANNRANRDSYLIFGVEDKTFRIVGVENDSNRKNQQQIGNFLRTPVFAKQIRPRVEVRTIILENHEVDIFIIKNSTDVPYYLIEDYQDKKYKIDKKRDGKIVRAFHIYTRVVDNNTPINQSADIDDVEQLWKKRFGLLQTPLEQVKTLLNRPNEWQEENSCYYHSLFPQYTIRIEWDADQDDYDYFEENPEFYHFCQIKQSAHYGVLKIYHYGTQMYSCQVTELDGFRLCIPCPEWGYIDQPRYDLSITYKYYLKSSLLYSLLLFLVYKYNSMNGGEADNAVNRLLKVVLLFEDEYAANYFKLCVIEKHDLYIDLYNKEKEPYIETDSELVAKQEKKRIRDSLVLKKIQALIENG